MRKVNLLAVDRKVSNDEFFHELPVDAKLHELTVSVSGQQPQIIVTDPLGLLAIIIFHLPTFYVILSLIKLIVLCWLISAKCV